MGEWLSRLSDETVATDVIDRFVRWCVWEQTVPALIMVLERTGLSEQVDSVKQVSTYAGLANAAEKAGHEAHEARRRTGPLGLSAAEAVSFLVTRIALAATETEWDPEGVAFYAAQVAGWAGFAESGFTNSSLKNQRESEAREIQESRLKDIWQAHQDNL